MDKDVLEKCGEVKLVESVASSSGDKVWPMTKELVGCGYPTRNPEVDLRIVNMEDCSELEEGKVQFPCLLALSSLSPILTPICSIHWTFPWPPTS